MPNVCRIQLFLFNQGTVITTMAFILLLFAKFLLDAPSRYLTIKNLLSYSHNQLIMDLKQYMSSPRCAPSGSFVSKIMG